MSEELKAQIPRVKLGNQGLEVSKLGFGCCGLTGYYNDPLPEEDGIQVIKHAFNEGITFFDTADMYGANANEILVGKALKQLPRDKIQLATKFGIINMAITGLQVSGTPEYVRKCCEASLKRLDVKYIDLYYQHRVDKSVPIEDTMGELKKLVEEGKIKYIGLSEASPDTIKRAHAVHPITAVQMEWSLWTRELKKLVEEGKIKYIGLSEASPDTIKRAHAVHPITAVQMEWSLWTRDIETEIIPLCRELGIGIVTYSPIGRGFFGGKAVIESVPTNSFLAGHPRFTGENLEKNKILYERFAKLAANYICTPPQLALSWVLHQGDDVVPIPGTTKLKNLNDNIGSLMVKLTGEDLKRISDAIPMDEVAGARIFEKLSLHTWKFANTPVKDGSASA